MSEDKQPIDQLLERYFSAETTVEEEGVLADYFNSESLAPEHQPYQPVFQWAAEERQITPASGFEDRILASIGRQTPVKRLQVNYRPWAYAASIALLIGAIWFITRPTQVTSTLVLTEDTFDNPEEAFLQFSAALAMVGNGMEQGQQLTIQSVAPASELDIFTIQ